MAKIVGWVVKVKEQKRCKGGKVLMRAILTSKDREGNYYDPMWLSIFVGEKTTWKKADYIDEYVSISGDFFHSDSEWKGKKYKDYSIWAESIEKFEFEKKKGKKSTKAKKPKKEEEEEEEDDFMTLEEEDEDIPFN